VRNLLSNEVYAGVAVFGKERFYLNARQSYVPRAQWKRRRLPSGGIVSRQTWSKAASLLAEGRRRYVSDEVLLADLQKMHARAGHVSAEVISRSDGYGVALYKRRFGSLVEAYVRAGLAATPAECRTRLRAQRPAASYRRNHPSGSDEELLVKLGRVLAREGRLSNRIIEAAKDCPSVPVYRRRFGGLRHAYALVGYQPTRTQDLHLEAHGQDITGEAAARICADVLRRHQPGREEGGDEQERHGENAPAAG
jgi:hypothetical protein